MGMSKTRLAPTDKRKREQLRRAGGWLISTLAWGPLTVWVAWPRLDSRLAWHPVVGYSGIVALALSWVYVGRLGVNGNRLPTVVAILVAFNGSFAVAAGSSDIGAFAAGSIVGGGLMSGIASALIVILAVLAVQVRDYGSLEDQILLTAPLVVAAMMAGITVGAIARDAGTLLLGLMAGLAAAAIVSVFVLSWVYGAVGIASSWVARRGDSIEPTWWPGDERRQ
jgi:hypothetical protein